MIYPYRRQTPEELAAQRARAAYGYAYQTTPNGVTWGIIGSLLTSSAAKVTYFVPAAGYVILYGDYFRHLFTFSALAPAKGVLSFTERVNCLYWGSILLLVAYGLYLYLSPRLIRNKTSVHQFVGDVWSSHDYSTAAEVLEESIAFLKSVNTSYLDPDMASRLETSLNFMVRKSEALDFHEDGSDTLQNTLRFYFNWKQSDRNSMGVGVIMALAYLLLLMPAFDLFIRVAQVTTGIYIPGLPH